MLQSHLNAIEQVLLAQSRTAKNAGHPNLRGGPREWFIRDFLSAHLPSTLEIGQGEIIDCKSQPAPPRGSYRPQVDIVVYRRDLPKISYSQTDCAYLVEGVMATIESKSVLTKEEFENACRASSVHKSLQRQASAGMKVGNVPDKTISYIVAFDGPAQMSTVADWYIDYIRNQSVSLASLVELVVILGKGVLWRIDAFPELSVRVASGHQLAFIDQADKNLFTLFSHMLTWVSASSTPTSTIGYLANVPFANVRTQ